MALSSTSQVTKNTSSYPQKRTVTRKCGGPHIRRARAGDTRTEHTVVDVQVGGVAAALPAALPALDDRHGRAHEPRPGV